MLPTRKRPWTAEEDQRLLEMISRQRPRTSIAAALRRSVAAVSGRLKTLRKTPAPISPRSADPVQSECEQE
jgi:hypothetical protein